MLGTGLARTALPLDIEAISEAICKLLEGLVADDFAPYVRSECEGTGAVCPRLHTIRERWMVQGEDRGHPDIEPRENPFVSLIQPDMPIEHLNIVTGQLELHNRILAQLDDDVPFSDRVEKRPSIAKGIRKIYAHLHEAIRKDWHCNCVSHHIVNLRLNANTPDDEREALEVDFFFYRGPIPPRWQEGRICVREDNVSHFLTPGKKRARFQNDDDPEDGSDLARISNVCQHVSTWERASSCLRMRLENGSFCEIPPVSRTHNDLLPRRAISLDELLTLGNFTSAGKRILAVILARSILPLLGTPWLSRLWTRANIFFAYQRDGRLSEPFLSASLNPEHTNDNLGSPVQHLWPGLLCLGILLWEIQLGQPIEEFWEDDNLEEAHDPTNTNYCTAVRLLQIRREDLSPHYAEALDTCLNAGFPSMLPEHEAKWQGPDETDWHTMYNKIVFPLEADLMSGSGHVLPQPWSEAVRTLSDIWRRSEVMCWSPPVPLRSGRPTASVSTRIPTSYSVLPTRFNRVNTSYQLFDDQFADPGKARDTREWLHRMQHDFEAHLDVPSSSRIKIAVLDSGYDSSDAFIRGSISRVAERHCLQDEFRADQDQDGHGTHILAFLLKYAPFAELYVLRLSPTQSLEDVDYVAQAVDYAVEKWHVDMITMSFGFPSRTGRLSDAVAKAASKNVIMFAAASNSGGNHGRAYPASDSRVICVHSTDGKGNRSSFSPTAKKNCDNFALPGENIESSWPRSSGSATCTKMKSGTSFATPVAVALAANILEYAEQKLVAMPQHLRDYIKSSDGMSAIFRLMVREQDHLRDGYDYLTPWKLFGQERSDAYIYHMMKTALEE